MVVSGGPHNYAVLHARQLHVDVLRGTAFASCVGGSFRTRRSDYQVVYGCGMGSAIHFRLNL